MALSDRRLWCSCGAGNALGRWHLQLEGWMATASWRPGGFHLDSHRRVPTPGAPPSRHGAPSANQPAPLHDVQAFRRASSRGPGAEVAVTSASSDRTTPPSFATALFGPGGYVLAAAPVERTELDTPAGPTAKGAPRPWQRNHGVRSDEGGPPRLKSRVAASHFGPETLNAPIVPS
jgi:hypothetical protein